VKIKTRLALLFAAGTALLIGVGGAVFVHALGLGLDNSLLSGLQTRAATIQSSLHSLARSADMVNRGSPPDVDQVSQVLVIRSGHLHDLVPGFTRPLLSLQQWSAARSRPMELEEALGNSDSPLMVWAVPAAADAAAVIAVANSTDTVDFATDRVETALAVGGPLGVILAGLAGWLIAAAALRPVERMRSQAAEMSTSTTRSGLDIPRTRDEVAALGRTLNELIETARQAADQQTAFVSAAGHELRTPLSNLKLELELAARPGRTRDELSSAVADAAEEVDRLARLAEDLLFLARRDEGQLVVLQRPIDLGQVARSSLEAFSATAQRRAVHLGVAGAEQVMASADADRLRQVLDNLLDNALRFSPVGGSVQIRIQARGAQAVLSVDDQGPGFHPSFLTHAFERFSVGADSRTRNESGGAGLGLAIVQSIAEAHGGWAQAENRPEGGARVSVAIPLAQPTGPTGSSPPDEQTSIGGDVTADSGGRPPQHAPVGDYADMPVSRGTT
jgi:two-component system OmpR family sensor kinase